MGWLYMRNMEGFSSPRSYLDNQFTYSREDRRSTVLASALVGSTVYYAAVEHIAGGAAPEIFAVICLVRYNPRAADGFVFGYKDMEESMGPYEAEAPEAILELLTPTTSENALAWREQCCANLTRRKLAAARPAPRPGQTIVFEPALELSDGQTVARFAVITDPRRPKRLLFRDPASGVVVRIPNIKKRTYRLINPVVTTA